MNPIDLEAAVAAGLAKVTREEESIHQFDLAVARAAASMQRETDASMIESMGCNCRFRYAERFNGLSSIMQVGRGEYQQVGDERHLADCPVSLATKLRGQP